MFTEYGIRLMEEAKKSGLYSFYDEFMGNFGFTTEELKNNNVNVAIWLSSHKNYGLVYQSNEAYNGKCWWLTEVEY